MNDIKAPLPWKVARNDYELRITDARGDLVIYGNVNRGIEFDDPEVPKMLERAFELLNQDMNK